MREENLPLERDEALEIVKGAIAGEALDSWIRGYDLAEIDSDPIYRDKVFLITELVALPPLLNAEATRRFLDVISKPRLDELLAKGHTEEEAQKMLKAKTMGRFIARHQNKDIED